MKRHEIEARMNYHARQYRRAKRLLVSDGLSEYQKTIGLVKEASKNCRPDTAPSAVRSAKDALKEARVAASALGAAGGLINRAVQIISDAMMADDRSQEDACKKAKACLDAAIAKLS